MLTQVAVSVIGVVAFVGLLVAVVAICAVKKRPPQDDGADEQNFKRSSTPRSAPAGPQPNSTAAPLGVDPHPHNLTARYMSATAMRQWGHGEEMGLTSRIQSEFMSRQKKPAMTRGASSKAQPQNDIVALTAARYLEQFTVGAGYNSIVNGPGHSHPQLTVQELNLDDGRSSARSNLGSRVRTPLAPVVASPVEEEIMDSGHGGGVSLMSTQRMMNSAQHVSGNLSVTESGPLALDHLSGTDDATAGYLRPYAGEEGSARPSGSSSATNAARRPNSTPGLPRGPSRMSKQLTGESVAPVSTNSPAAANLEENAEAAEESSGQGRQSDPTGSHTSGQPSAPVSANGGSLPNPEGAPPAGAGSSSNPPLSTVSRHSAMSGSGAPISASMSLPRLPPQPAALLSTSRRRSINFYADGEVEVTGLPISAFRAAGGTPGATSADGSATGPTGSNDGSSSTPGQSNRAATQSPQQPQQNTGSNHASPSSRSNRLVDGLVQRRLSAADLSPQMRAHTSASGTATSNLGQPAQRLAYPAHSKLTMSFSGGSVRSLEDAVHAVGRHGESRLSPLRSGPTLPPAGAAGARWLQLGGFSSLQNITAAGVPPVEMESDMELHTDDVDDDRNTFDVMDDGGPARVVASPWSYTTVQQPQRPVSSMAAAEAALAAACRSAVQDPQARSDRLRYSTAGMKGSLDGSSASGSPRPLGTPGAVGRDATFLEPGTSSMLPRSAMRSGRTTASRMGTTDSRMFPALEEGEEEAPAAADASVNNVSALGGHRTSHEFVQAMASEFFDDEGGDDEDWESDEDTVGVVYRYEGFSILGAAAPASRRQRRRSLVLHQQQQHALQPQDLSRQPRRST